MDGCILPFCWPLWQTLYRETTEWLDYKATLSVLTKSVLQEDMLKINLAVIFLGSNLCKIFLSDLKDLKGEVFYGAESNQFQPRINQDLACIERANWRTKGMEEKVVCQAQLTYVLNVKQQCIAE